MRRTEYDLLVKKEQKEYWDDLLKPLYSANILLENEEIYDAKRAVAIKADNSSVSGLLVLTQVRIIFLLDKVEIGEDVPSYIGLLHEKILETNISVDESDKSKGKLNVYYETMVFRFENLMRFGLNEWGNFVKEKGEQKK